MDRNQLLFAMGVIKGMLASAIDEDVKMSLNISLELIGKTLQGYEMVMPEPVGMAKPAPEELKEPEPVYANDETVDDYLPNMVNKED